MKTLFVCGLILATAISSGACRQADGSVPTPSGETEGEIADIGRDLLSIAAREEQAPLDLAHDLRKYSERPDVQASSDELSSRTASVVAGSALTEQAARQLAHSLWVTVAAREMSERQIEAFRNDFGSVLTSIGIDQGRAEPVVAQVEEIQRLVTTRTKRWYEVF